MSTYITTVLAGPYFKAEDAWRGTLADGTVLDVPLALYCRASMAASFDTDALFRLTRNGLSFFNELFDFPYPWGKYEQAFVPEYNLGAMENPGLVTFTEATSSPPGPPIRSTRPAPTRSCTRWRTCGSGTSSP